MMTSQSAKRGEKAAVKSLSNSSGKVFIGVLSMACVLTLSGCQGLKLKRNQNVQALANPPQSTLSLARANDVSNASNNPLHTINTDNLNITDAVGIAIARHPDIGRASAVVVQSNAQISIEKSAWYPTFQYGVDPGYNRYYAASNSDRTGSSVRGSVGVTQLVYDFGRTSSRIGVAKATYEKDSYLLSKAVEDVATNMSVVFVELSASQELIAAAEREYGAMRRTREKIAERVESGLSDAVDLNQADLAIQRARSDLLSAQNRFDIAAGRFAEITGIRPTKVANMETTSKFLDSLGRGRNTIENTPNVLAADAEVKASLERVRLAKAQLYPSVSVAASQQKSTGQRNITNDNSFVGLQLSGSLNSGFREKHQIASAQAEVNAAKQASENERLVARTTVSSAKTEADGATARMDNSKQLMSLSLTSRDLYWQQYTLNKRPLTDVVNAERETFIAESEYVTAMADYMTARIKAYTAVGELVERLRGGR
ncbi:TolC family protein [Bartonella sp. HY761]|uniref:TolC family protein n=1 Tax=Bartonella sp. HY761 TaxID=2979330 RepID=UPI00220FC912|nr:TolC family protein [Bartonella sp. HY761]UXN07395.1 TolC family protein [Bartonella sp. HY761]